MKTQGINSEKTKAINRLLVLRMVCTNKNMSRAEITRRTGLAKMTVSNIVGELIENGVLCESHLLSTATKSRAGRKQTSLCLTENAPVGIGVWVARDYCIGVMATMDLGELKQYRIDLTENETAQSVVDKLESIVVFLLDGVTRPVVGIGIAAIGPLDIASGTLLNPPNFYGIESLPLAGILSERVGLPVYIQNDMNASALAEKYYGNCKSTSNFVYLGITNGVGAGLVMFDRLYEGQHGFAGEIGHISINKEGPLCHCGNRGCLETYVSVPKVLKDFKARFGGGIRTFEEACQLAEQDPAARALLDETLDNLTVALINCCNIYDPEKIIIGHEGVSLSEAQLAVLQQNMNAKLLGSRVAKVKIQRSSFGKTAPAAGAVVVLLQKVFGGLLFYDEIFPAR